MSQPWFIENACHNRIVLKAHFTISQELSKTAASSISTQQVFQVKLQVCSRALPLTQLAVLPPGAQGRHQAEQ